jgi:hypothetical protein
MKIDWTTAIFSVALLCFSAYLLLTEPTNPAMTSGVRLLTFGANALWFGMSLAGWWYRQGNSK